MATLTKMEWETVTIISSAGDPYSDIGQTIHDILVAHQSDGFDVVRWHQDMEIGISKRDIKARYAILKKEARSKSHHRVSIGGTLSETCLERPLP